MAKRIVAFVGSRDLPIRFRVEVDAAVDYEVGTLGAEVWTGDCPTGVDTWVRERTSMLGADVRVFEPRKSDIKAHGYRAALAMRAERIADELEAERQKGADVMVRAWSRPGYRGEPTAGTKRTTDRAVRLRLPLTVSFRGEARDG